MLQWPVAAIAQHKMINDGSKTEVLIAVSSDEKTANACSLCTGTERTADLAVCVVVPVHAT